MKILHIIIETTNSQGANNLKSLLLSKIILSSLSSFMYDLPKSFSALDLLDKWREQGYPNDFGGLYWDKGYVLLIVNPTNNRKEELRRMINEPICILEADISYKELMLINHDLCQQIGINGLIKTGIGCIDVSAKTCNHTCKKFRVFVSVQEKYYAARKQEFTSKYGDFVHISIGGYNDVTCLT